MKKLLLASASVLTLISACTKEVEVADRAGILQKFPGYTEGGEVAQDIGIERLTTTLPQELGGQTIVANVMREGISEELSEGFIEEYSYAIAGEILDGENAWYNEETKTKINIRKNIQFWSFPNILVIDLFNTPIDFKIAISRVLFFTKIVITSFMLLFP